MSPATLSPEIIDVEKLASAHPVESHFAEFTEQLHRVKATAETLVVKDENDTLGMKLAGETRKALKTIRCAIENRRKELGEESLRRTQRINGVAKQMIALIEPLEERMIEQETTALRAAAQRKVALLNERTEAIRPFVATPVSVGDIGRMTEGEFTRVLLDARGMHEARIAREQKEREEAEAKAAGEIAERERMRAENERLREEVVERQREAAIEREKAESARRQAERVARIEREKADRVREEIERMAREEREKAEEERRVAEAKVARERAKERKAAEAVARTERMAREKAEADLREKQLADEAKQKAEAAAARKAATAPDREKLIAYADALADVPTPVMASEEGREEMGRVRRDVLAFCRSIRIRADEL